MIICGDARHIPLADGAVNCVVTSPPYWNLRDYGLGSGALGLEPSPELYVSRLVEIFREVRRVLRDDGTLWLNLGDCYSAAGRKGHGTRLGCKQGTNRASANGSDHIRPSAAGLKPKDLVGIPWRVAFALQADGWYLRSDIIWAKPNPMPESVTDRPTKAHEHIFLLAKSERYYFNQDAVRVPYAKTRAHRESARWVQGWASEKAAHTAIAHAQPKSHHGSKFTTGKTVIHQNGRASKAPREDSPNGHNLRTVWSAEDPELLATLCAEFPAVRERVCHLIAKNGNKTIWWIATQPYSGAHFATFNEKLAETCILAGCPPGGLVLDPFSGSGTVGRVAERLNRRWVLLDLKYQDLARQRTRNLQKDLIL